ncbi:fibrobacter succinogenes major paralogous domain-containing protein [Longitalea luteola]|uniref:fibrobacter succinogenes major paralogous domain-containing protein n=1 Tax=Longitalea luteola TaxID=2812563 RepID=UPI001A96DF15|nr:fibrobacter succinogenes major paralogous domain-containing protein [Longitalea luteola]
MKPNTCIDLLYIILLTGLTHCTTGKADNQVTDIDGHVYATVTIGNKVWMAENLRVTRYRNGDLIPHIEDTTAWSTSTTGAWCNYNNDAGNAAIYGRLYNWYAINDSRNIAPEGWHIPTDEEIAALISLLETKPAMAEIVKAKGLGGYRFCNGGSYHTIDFNGYWWSATRSYEIYDWSSRLFTGFADVQRNRYESNFGLAVRCVKD